MKFLKKYWFLLGIFCALVLGYVFSDAAVSANPRSITSSSCIVILFFIAGISLPTDSIKEDLKDFRLHIFVQLFIFLFIPGTVYLITLALRPFLGEFVRVGLYTVAVLPTTISSCIVFTQLSQGNVVGSMFNSAVANILAVFLSPLLLSFLMRGAGAVFSFGQLGRILISLGLKMLLPVAAGQLLRRRLISRFPALVSRLKTVSNILIIIIIFFAFAKTAGTPEFRAILPMMPVPLILLGVLHILYVLAAYTGGRIIGLSKKSKIAALFTASQKSAAMGVPFAAAFFAAKPEYLGIALLLIVFYHSWQLLVAGVVRTFPVFSRVR